MGVLVNLGCGLDYREGWVNVDLCDTADVQCDITDGLPFPDDHVERYLALDFVEHVWDPLALFDELWRCAEPGCVIEIALPYGSSDDAWLDPTHCRPYFVDSWTYFAQPHYYRLDYGYRADWQVEQIILDVDETEDDDLLPQRLMRDRNVVSRMYVAMRAVKPARPRDPDLRRQSDVKFRKVARDNQ